MFLYFIHSFMFVLSKKHIKWPDTINEKSFKCTGNFMPSFFVSQTNTNICRYIHTRVVSTLFWNLSFSSYVSLLVINILSTMESRLTPSRDMTYWHVELTHYPSTIHTANRIENKLFMNLYREFQWMELTCQMNFRGQKKSNQNSYAF